MIEKLVTTFVEFQLGIGTIQDDDVNVYRYGYTLMIEVILNMTLSLIVGALLRQIKEVIFFLCMFIPLRSFCGGYHAKKAWQCAIVSNLSVVGALALSELLVQHSIPLFIIFLGETVLGIVIGYFSPVESQNKKFNAVEQKLYKKYAKNILMIEIAVEIVFLISGNQKMFSVLFCAHITQAVSLLIVFCKSKKRSIVKKNADNK